MVFAKVNNDIAFKKIFTRSDKLHILVAFLNAVLQLEAEQAISQAIIVEPESKYALINIETKNKLGESSIINLQLENVEGYEKRFLYYSAKAYVAQLRRGDDYPKLKPVRYIGITDFNLFSGNQYVTKHLIFNQSTKAHEIKDFDFTFIELPKFNKDAAHLSSKLDEWVYFLRHAHELTQEPTKISDESLKAAYELARFANWSPEEVGHYDHWSIISQDEKGAVERAKDKEKERLAQSLLQEGVAFNIVRKVSGLSQESVMDMAKRFGRSVPEEHQ
ncbi:MAG: Rpn family recombination-promoting nuclease/putative transposase [Deinococcales bacterium]